MRRCGVLVLSLLSCGKAAYLPDGGRPLRGCTSSRSVIPVKTVDVNGMPVMGALVTARNQNSGQLQTGNTNGSGDTNAITEELGAGQIEISAQANDLKSTMSFLVQIACDSCECTHIPGSATVILQ
jgi:hypothetical protein